MMMCDIPFPPLLGITVGGQQYPAYQVQGGSGNLSGFQIVHQPISVQQQQQQATMVTQQGQIQPGQQVITFTTQGGLTATAQAQVTDSETLIKYITRE